MLNPFLRSRTQSALGRGPGPVVGTRRSLSGKLVSQDQSGLGAQKGCAPLWPCVSVDSATVQVRTEVTLWGCAGDGGEPRIAGNVTVVSSCGVRGPGIVDGGRGVTFPDLPGFLRQVWHFELE